MMASSHKLTKADKRPKSGKRRDRGAETMAALKRIDAKRAYEEICTQMCLNVLEADLADGKYDNWEQKPKPPLGPIPTFSTEEN